jgi:hypothetical protein
MSRKILPWFLLICALGLSTTAAYYSIIGLSIVFSAVSTPVIIMGSFLEASKLIIATYLHNQWKNTLLGLKIYLTTALIILSFITSIGIYGLLSHGFNENISKLEVNDKVINNISVKKDRFQSIKEEKQQEHKSLTQDISNLREALSTGTRVEYKDRETGEIIRTTSSSARRAFESQLETTLISRDELNTQIDALNDSITKLELEILDLQTDETLNGELGVVKYLSETLNKPIKTVSTWLILLLIFVFDPLAITLVIATNQAFKNSKPKKNIYGEKKEQPIWDKVEEMKRHIPHSPKSNEEEPLALANSQHRETSSSLKQQEIDRINKSEYSARKKKQMIKSIEGKTY